MTGKERVQAVLKHDSTDRLAFVPCIDPYFRSGLETPYDTMDIYELQAYCGTDMLRGVCCYKTRFDETVQHIHQEDKAAQIIDIYKTPLGDLREVQTFTEQSPYIPFPTEHLIKQIEDLKIYRYLLHHTMIKPDYDNINAIIKKFDTLMVSCSVEDTSFRQLLTKKIGVKNFVYLFYENQSEIEETLSDLAAHFNKLLEVSVQGPAEVFICYENTNITNSSMDWFENYELPLLNTYADIVHQYGKKLLIHMCGRIQLLLEKIVNARFDGIIDVSPPPTGDLDIMQAIPVFSKRKKILAGGIECNTFVQIDLKKFEEKVSDFLNQIPDLSCFMLGSGDAVPKGTTLKHFEVIKRLLNL
jgi:uroporphyrinogen-III decarboxylase